jgi:hypothetical protein
MELGPAPQSPPVPLGVAKSLLPAKSPASDTQSPSRSRNGTRSRRGSSGSTQRDVLFSQPAGVRRSPNVRRSAGGRGSQSSEQINVSKLTQEIFRKRIGAGGKRPRKKYEQKERSQRVGTPLNSTGLLGGGGIAPSRQSGQRKKNIDDKASGLNLAISIGAANDEVKVEEVPSKASNIPIRAMVKPNGMNDPVHIVFQENKSKRRSADDKVPLTGWATDMLASSPQADGEPTLAPHNERKNADQTKSKTLRRRKKNDAPRQVLLKYKDSPLADDVPEVRFTYSAEGLGEGNVPEAVRAVKRRGQAYNVIPVPASPIHTNVKFSPMVVKKTTQKSMVISAHGSPGSNQHKKLPSSSMPKKIEWNRQAFMLPGKASYAAAAAAKVPYDRVLPSLPKGVENFAMALGGVHLKQSLDVLPQTAVNEQNPEDVDSDGEEAIKNPAFKTAKSAAQFWLRNLLRTHNFKQAAAQGGWRGKEHVRRLAEFLASAVSHVRYAVQAEGWTAPDRAELERQIYNIVVDELSHQVASQATSRGSLLEMITAHFQDVVGDALPIVIGRNETQMSAQRKEMEKVQEENRRLMAEITKLRKDTKHIAFAAPTESLDSVKHEAEAAKRLVTSRDAEIISLRRQVASLKRSLDQSQLQSSNQAVELTTVRSTLMQREDESIQKVKEAKEVSIKLRKQLTEALTKVAKAEENEQWLEDQDYPGQISAAERRLKDAVDNETVVKKKLHNANRTELSLYSKVKDLEQFTTDMEGNIRDLKGYQNLMQGMMGRVESIRRASVAIRHNIPVSKLSGDPAVMQEVVNRMTAKAIEAEKKMNEVITVRDKLQRQLSLEQQKVSIQTQQVLDAREAQSRLEIELFELHEEFDSTVGDLRESNANFREKVEQLESENLFLMEHASSPDTEGSSAITVTEEAVLKLKGDVNAIKKEQEGIMTDTQDMLLEFEGLFSSLAHRINEKPVTKDQIKVFTDSILEAAQPSPVTKAIGRRRSIQNLKAKKRAKKRVKKRRMKLDKKFTEEDAANDEKFEMAVELSKATLLREKELLENKIMMMQLEYESATKRQQEKLENTEKALKESVENNDDLQKAKVKVEQVNAELEICNEDLKSAKSLKEEKEKAVQECQTTLEEAIVRLQQEELLLEDIDDSGKKDEQRVIISDFQKKVKDLEAKLKPLKGDLKLASIEHDRLKKEVAKVEQSAKEVKEEALRIEAEDPEIKTLKATLEQCAGEEIVSLKQLSGTRRKLKRVKNDLSDVGHLRNKATAVLRTAGRKGVDEESKKVTDPKEHEKVREDTVRDLAAKQAKALFAENKVASMEKQLLEVRETAAKENPELAQNMARIKQMREEREKQELLLIQLRKDLKINLGEKKEIGAEQNSLEQRMSKLKEDLRKSQVQYDMKVGIKKQQKQAILEEGGMPPPELDKDEDEMRLESHLVDVKAILEECKQSWDAAEEKMKNLMEKHDNMETGLATKASQIEELDQEADRIEDEISIVESQDMSIQQIKNQYLEACEEEEEVWDEVAATQAAVALLDTESAEIQEAEEERIRQKRAAAKREREAQLEAQKPREIEVEEEITEIVIDADGTKREVKKKVKRKVKLKPARSRAVQTMVVVSKEAANAALPMLRSLMSRVQDERTYLGRIRKDTRSSLQRMGGELSAFANKLGEKMGMHLELKKVEIKAPPTPPPKSTGASLSGDLAKKGSAAGGPQSLPKGNLRGATPKIDDSQVPGTSSWLANNAGALEEFNRVQESMKKEIDNLSSEQREKHDDAATKIQAMVRGKLGKNVVKGIRRAMAREEEATRALLEFGAAEDEDAGDVQRDTMKRMMGVDSKVMKMESQNNLKRAEEADPGAWEQEMQKAMQETKRRNAKITEQERAVQKAQMERSIKLRKRVILVERRVKELENILTRKFASKFKFKAKGKTGGISNLAAASASGSNEEQPNSSGQIAERLANTPGSVKSIGDPKFQIPKLTDHPGTGSAIVEEADTWADKPSWNASMPGLRKNYPSSLAKNTTPGGANPNEWRSRQEFSRGAWGSRVERYRLNKQSFHDLLRKRAGLTPMDNQAKGLDGNVLSKTVKDQLVVPTQWSTEDNGSVPRATTPASEIGDSTQNLEPRPIAWVMKSIRSVYDDKLLAECAAYRNGFQAPTLPEYLCEWASVRYGVTALVEQMCWDLYRSVQFYRSYSIEVDTFANFMDEVYSPADLSFFLYSRALVLDTMGEASSASQSTLAPAPVPLSAAIKIGSRVLAGLSPTQLASALHKFDVNAKPSHRGGGDVDLDISALFSEAKEKESVSAYASVKVNNDQKAQIKREHKILLAFKERLLASCGRDASSSSVVTRSGEREIDSQRFLYLCLREFRSAQRKFKRTLKDTLKVSDLSRGFEGITSFEFAPVALSVVPTWSKNEAEMVFRQGQMQVQNTREKDGFSTTETTRVPGKTLVKLGTQMWCHTFLLPHARVSDPYDPDGKISLERRLQTLLGAVSSHWPSFEPSLNRLANRVGKALSMSHAQSPSRDQGLRGDKSTLTPTVMSKMDGTISFNAHRKKPAFTPFTLE